MRVSTTLAAAGLATGATAENYLGFNSGSTLANNSAKFKSDFVAEFTTAQHLVGAPGVFNAMRLYTNIQAYSKADPIEAFAAAIETNSSLLLGVWCSGTDNIDNELTALQSAVTQYGTAFTDLVIGISIGSEDLYRNSVTGVKNDAGVGTQPDVLLSMINAYKKAVSGTALANVPVGHVDTWDVWTNSSNKEVLDAVDWVGVDEYPYYQTGDNNTIENAPALFNQAYEATVASVGGKPVWVTETGWPLTGPNWDQAVPSVANAKYYWDNVGCRSLFGKVPTFWYTLEDANSDNEMTFAITDNLSTNPSFNLTCPTTFAYNPSSSSSSASGTATATPQSSSASGSGSGSGSTFTTSGVAAQTASTSGSRTTSTSASASASTAKSGASSRGNMAAAAACAALGAVAGVVALV